MARRRRAFVALDPVMIVMADMLFQMLVFALLSAQGGQGAVSLNGDVELPPGPKGTPQAPAQPHVILTIDAQKKIYVNNEAAQAADLRDLLARVCAGANAPYVLIRCDGRVDLKSLLELQAMLLDDLKVSKVEFAVLKGGRQ